MALIEMELSAATAYQLNHAARPDLTNNTERKMVTDLLDVTSTPNHIIVNPSSNPKLPWEVAGAWDGKQAIYAAFKFALDEFSVFAPGRHECSIDLRIPRTLHAQSFRTDQNGRWHCFRVQNGSLVEITFRQKAEMEPYDLWLRDNYQNLHDCIDAIMQGAYCDVDLSDAPQLYAYFLSLLAMEPEEAKKTIFEHESRKIAQNNAWITSKDKEPLEAYIVDGKQYPADLVKEMGLKATNDSKGFSFNVNGKNLAYVTELVEEGYVLSSL